MKASKLFFVIVLSTYLQLVCAQTEKGYIYPIHNKMYFHEGDTLTYRKMAHVFSKNMDYKKRYRRSKIALGTGSVFGWMSVAALASGIPLILIPENQGSISIERLWGFALVIVATPVTGTIGVIAHFRGKKRKQLLINDFNLSINDKGKVRQIPTLHFGTSSGIGIVLKF